MDDIETRNDLIDQFKGISRSFDKFSDACNRGETLTISFWVELKYRARIIAAIAEGELIRRHEKQVHWSGRLVKIGLMITVCMSIFVFIGIMILPEIAMISVWVMLPVISVIFGIMTVDVIQQMRKERRIRKAIEKECELAKIEAEMKRLTKEIDARKAQEDD